jgi:uncharacterized Ntn-hydrolase superfamily protein
MMRVFFVAALMLAVSAQAHGQTLNHQRPVNTFSIVARDPQTGQMGVAVQSHWFSVGSEVPWAAPGVGAVATQSFVEPSYGPLGLELMRSGKTAGQAMAALLAGDAHPEVRQVGMIDAHGHVAGHTGANSIHEFCQIQGDNFTVQANLMERASVCQGMAEGFANTHGDLAARLLGALEGAQREHGDIRGMQSAAILVVSGDASLPAWGGRIFDLRVEDNPQPIAELERLVTLERAYNLMTEGDNATAAGDLAAAAAHYHDAMALAPNNHEMIFWTAVSMASTGHVDEALPLFRRAFRLHPLWRELVQRLPRAGLMPDDPALMRRILAVR